MLNGLISGIKLALFSIFILILANTIHWNGKTISDQVKVNIVNSDYFRWVNEVQKWAGDLTLDARRGMEKKLGRSSNPVTITIPEDISASEKQKLRALIQELNTSHRKD